MESGSTSRHRRVTLAAPPHAEHLVATDLLERRGQSIALHEPQGVSRDSVPYGCGKGLSIAAPPLKTAGHSTVFRKILIAARGRHFGDQLGINWSGKDADGSRRTRGGGRRG